VNLFKIPKKVSDRISDRVKNFQQVALSHKARDVSEADTVTLVKDILSDVCGYDKYAELTSEQQIKGTFCDLAVKIDGKIHILIEVKAAGVTLNTKHLQQALNYGANQGTEWIILTNSVEWQLYKVKFGQPIDFEEVTRFDFPTMSPKSEEHLQQIFLICKEGLVLNAMHTFHNQSQILNRFTITQILLDDDITSAIRREFRRLFPDIRVESEDIAKMLVDEIVKREVLEGDKVKEAQQKIRKITSKRAKETANAAKLKSDESGKSDVASEPE
jgi:hypothetical protein